MAELVYAPLLGSGVFGHGCSTHLTPTTMKTTVKLSDTELDLARKIASLRYGSNREAGIKNAKIGKQSSFETDFIGMCGELAFCKMVNIYPDLTIEAGGHQYDCLLRSTRIDIKTTHYKNGNLLSGSKKEYDEIDVFVLVVGDPASAEFTFVGWQTYKELRMKKNISEQFKGSYALPQDKLETPEKLLAYVM